MGNSVTSACSSIAKDRTTQSSLPMPCDSQSGSLIPVLTADIEGYRKTLSDIWRQNFAVLPRMRLACQVFDAQGGVVDRCAGAGSGMCAFACGVNVKLG